MTLANLILALRNLAADAADSNPIFGEQLGGDLGMAVDGTNTKFRLHSAPLVGVAASAGSVYITVVGTSQRSQAGFTITDAAVGIITFTVAPAAGAVVLADYNHYWFSDAKHTEFLNEGSQNLLLDATVDPTLVPNGLVPAMMQYALASFFKARASQYQARYSSSGGESGQSVDSVAKGFAALARAAEKRGDELRTAYYQRQGQRDAPAVSIQTFGIDDITPRR